MNDRRATLSSDAEKITSAGYTVVMQKIEGGQKVEARAGIEPTCGDLQSPASPLCHRAIC